MSEILSSALQEVELFFPAVKQARLVKSGVLKEARATFSVTPGLDQISASAEDSVAGALSCGGLDGDGVAFDDGGRGAQRKASGRGAGGRCEEFMASETPASGLMRWLSRM